jgi:hypothetical protein
VNFAAKEEAKTFSLVSSLRSWFQSRVFLSAVLFLIIPILFFAASYS